MEGKGMDISVNKNSPMKKEEEEEASQSV